MVEKWMDLVGWSVGELVPQHEVTPLVAPLQDCHLVLVSGAQIHLALVFSLHEM